VIYTPAPIVPLIVFVFSAALGGTCDFSCAAVKKFFAANNAFYNGRNLSIIVSGRVYDMFIFCIIF